MTLLSDLAAVSAQDMGWVLVLIALVWQLFWPFWETRLQTVLGNVADEVRDDITDIRNRVRSVDEKVEDIDEKQLAHIQVTRALATKEEGIDDEAVDDYLVSNGVTKDHFFVEETPDDRRGRHPADDD